MKNLLWLAAAIAAFGYWQWTKSTRKGALADHLSDAQRGQQVGRVAVNSQIDATPALATWTGMSGADFNDSTVTPIILDDGTTVRGDQKDAGDARPPKNDFIFGFGRN